jgi:hypothetical protein
LPKGILTPSFIEKALAVMKHALLTDDDGHHQRGAIKKHVKHHKVLLESFPMNGHVNMFQQS